MGAVGGRLKDRASNFHQQGSWYLRNEKEASLPQGLHHSKRGQLLQETSACKYSIENQGIPWMQHCPVLGRIHFTWFKLYVRLLTFLSIVTLLEDLHPLRLLPHDAGEHLLEHRHSVGLFTTQEDGRLLATNHEKNISHTWWCSVSFSGECNDLRHRCRHGNSGENSEITLINVPDFV